MEQEIIVKLNKYQLAILGFSVMHCMECSSIDKTDEMKVIEKEIFDILGKAGMESIAGRAPLSYKEKEKNAKKLGL